jgi:hypothetical protein
MKQTADAMKEKAVAVAGMTWKRLRLCSAIIMNHESKHGEQIDCEEEHSCRSIARKNQDALGRDELSANDEFQLFQIGVIS